MAQAAGCRGANAARRAARFEPEAVQSVAGVLAVSEPERDHFERLAPGKVSLVPNGVDPTGYAFRDQVSRVPRILFVGSTDYSANADAASYLIRESCRASAPATRA